MDKPRDRIDTRFPRRRFPLRDTIPRSTLLHLVQRKNTECVRTFFSLDLPLRPSSDSPLLSSFASSDHLKCCSRDVVPSLHLSEEDLRGSTPMGEFRQLRHPGHVHAALQISR